MIAKLAGVEIYYELDGLSSAPVVCLAHCFGSDCRFWDAQLPALDGYRVLRFDARGHGRSSQPRGPYTISDMRRDVIGLLNFLGLPQVHLAGASMGGMVAQSVALEEPQRIASLALITTTFEYSAAQRQRWQELGRIAQSEGLAPLHDELMQRWFLPSSRDGQIPGYKYMDQVFRQFHPMSFAWAVEAIRLVGHGQHLCRIDAPTLIIASEHDPGVPPAVSLQMSESIPGSQFHWTPHAHHLASLEHPQMVANTYRAFLDDVAGE